MMPRFLYFIALIKNEHKLPIMASKCKNLKAGEK